MKKLLISLLIVGSLISCKKENKDTPVPTTTATEQPLGNTGCKPMWHLVKYDPGQNTSVTVENGFLNLEANTKNGLHNATVYQKLLVGDFDISLKFQDFLVTDSVHYNELKISVQDTILEKDYFYSSADFNPKFCKAGANTKYYDNTNFNMYLSSKPITSGKIEASRIKDTISYKIYINDKIVSRSKNLIPEKSKSLQFQIELTGNIFGDVAKKASVKFSEFRITGGGGKVYADSFDCDNIIK